MSTILKALRRLEEDQPENGEGATQPSAAPSSAESSTGAAVPGPDDSAISASAATGQALPATDPEAVAQLRTRILAEERAAATAGGAPPNYADGAPSRDGLPLEGIVLDRCLARIRQGRGGGKRDVNKAARILTSTKRRPPPAAVGPIPPPAPVSEASSSEPGSPACSRTPSPCNNLNAPDLGAARLTFDDDDDDAAPPAKKPRPSGALDLLIGAALAAAPP